MNDDICDSWPACFPSAKGDGESRGLQLGPEHFWNGSEKMTAYS